MRENDNGLFRVEQVEIEKYDDDGKITGSDLCFAVVSKLNIDNGFYQVRDEDTANDLCDQLNVLTCDLMLSDTLPKELSGVIFEDLAERINEKYVKIVELRTAVNHELAVELDYLHQANEWKLHPDEIKAELGLSKNPTEKQVNAFVENKLRRHFDLLKIAKANTSLIRNQIGLLDDMISYEKYVVRMRLKE